MEEVGAGGGWVGRKGSAIPTQTPASPGAREAGRFAATPAQIPWHGWRAVLIRTGLEAASDRVSLVAAGCAFWGTLALFPALSMLISIYGLVFDPVTVLPQLNVLREFLPPAAFSLVADRIEVLIGHPAASLQWSVAISAGVTLWSATTGTKALISALNVAYEETERRSFFVYQLVSLGITLAAVVAAVVGLAMMVLLPALLDFIGLAAHRRLLLTLGGHGVLVVFLLLGLSVLYRIGPCRRAASWAWVLPGAFLATFLWVGSSALFSWYVANLAGYDALYGPLGAVAGVLMWFWITIYAVLLGAEMNSELELQTAADTTGAGRPPGERGAFVADHVAGS